MLNPTIMKSLADAREQELAKYFSLGPARAVLRRPSFLRRCRAAVTGFKLGAASSAPSPRPVARPPERPVAHAPLRAYPPLSRLN